MTDWLNHPVSFLMYWLFLIGGAITLIVMVISALLIFTGLIIESFTTNKKENTYE